MSPSLALFETRAKIVPGLVAPLQEGPRLGVALQVEPPGRQLLLVVGLHRQLAIHVRGHLFTWQRCTVETVEYANRFRKG